MKLLTNRIRDLQGLFSGALAVATALVCMAVAQAQSDPLPSWNDGATKRAIVDFVSRVTKEGSPDFTKPSERIATFDNDGTLWSEQPIYFQLAFALDRVKELAPQRPEWKTQQPFKAVLEGDMKALASSDEKGLMELILATHTGITTDEFSRIVSEWLGRARHPRFKRPYTELVYQPMLELLAYLRANGFKTFIVSGGSVEFMRVFAEQVYGIPPEQVVGTTFVTKFHLGPDGKPFLMREAKIDFIDNGPGKPVAIQKFIGRRPLLAFGNSDGDQQMLQWTVAGPGPRFAGLVRHTDADREWAYDRESQIGKLDKALDEATARQWIVVDMKRDWKVVFTAALPRKAHSQEAGNGTSSSGEKKDAKPPATPPTAPEDWLHRDKLTGDWGGARKKLEDHGVTLEFELTQFYQGTASGGLEQNDAYGGQLVGEFKFDLGKLGLWKNGSIDAKAVTRYGTSASFFTGALLPVNTALLVPADSGTVTAVTTLTYTHVFPFEKPGDLFLVSVGKFDTIDLIADPLIGGAGLNKFLNINQVAPPIGIKNIPPVSIGWVGAWVKKGEPFISLSVLDSQDSSTTIGLSNLFENGITISPAITLPSQFFGKAGHHTLTLSYSDQHATPFDQIRQIILPEVFGTAVTRSGTRFWMYSFDQYISEIPGFPRQGWGLFGQFGMADRRTAPIQTWFNVGVGGNTPFKSRPRDWFGAAYSFNSISGDLKDAFARIGRLRDEHEFEAFYNYALTPWLFLTGDIQVVRPTRPRADTAWVPGLRMKIVF